MTDDLPVSKLKENEPFPEALHGDRGKGWGIGLSPDGNAHCDPTGKSLVVPLDSTCSACGGEHSHAIRRHEMAHARWTPHTHRARITKYEKEHKIEFTNDTIQGCEDMRMHLLLNDAQVHHDSLICPALMEEMRRNIKDWSLGQLARWLLSGMATPKMKDIQHEAAALNDHFYEARDIAQTAFEKMTHDLTKMRPSFEDMLAAAHYVDDTVGRLTKAAKGKDTRAQKKDAKEAVKEYTEAKARAEEQKEKSSSTHDPKLERELEEAGYGTSGTHGSKSTIWGEMTLINPPKPRALPGRLRSRYTSHDEGLYIRAMYRYPIDGRIFARRNKTKGGTLLLDLSGSMAWKIEQLWDILTKVPGVTIAGYSGNRITGGLSIFAKNGKICSIDAIKEHKHTIGGNNVVDGPALAWLCRQEEPRVFCSDGYITCPYGTTTQGAKERDMLIHIGRIRWVSPVPLANTPCNERTRKQKLLCMNNLGYGDEMRQAILDQLLIQGGRFAPLV